MPASSPDSARAWVGRTPTACDLCNKPIINVFIDGRTSFGPWANMCPECHVKFGVGLGTGRGQRYERDADGSWRQPVS